MSFRQERLGSTAVFLLPSLKLKEPGRAGSSLEDKLHTFLMDHFGGYTAQAGNIFGYWRDQSGRASYGEHREFTIALIEPGKLSVLKDYLAMLAAETAEECIYMETAGEAFLIYPAE
jgi:hypothetical protein